MAVNWVNSIRVALHSTQGRWPNHQKKQTRNHSEWAMEHGLEALNRATIWSVPAINNLLKSMCFVLWYRRVATRRLAGASSGTCHPTTKPEIPHPPDIPSIVGPLSRRRPSSGAASCCSLICRQFCEQLLADSMVIAGSHPNAPSFGSIRGSQSLEFTRISVQLGPLREIFVKSHRFTLRAILT